MPTRAGLALANFSVGAKTPRAGLAWAWACAASIAGYHLAYERALASKATPSPLFAASLATALPFVLVSLRGHAATSRASQLVRPRPLFRLALAGTLCTGSFLLFLDGLSRSGAGTALTLRNTSVVFAQAIALAIGERVSGRQLAGALLVLGGAVLVGSGI